MAQHDYIIANQSGAAFRADLNNGLAAIVSQNSGATAPSTTYAYQWWADTTTGLLKIRNAANNAWITIGTLADANLGLLSLAGGTLTGALLADDAGTAALPAIAFDGDPNTGIFRAGADQLGIATNGTARLTASTTAVTSSLPVIVPDGSAAGPSVTFTGSGTDTGLFSPAADQVAITTGGAARLTTSTTAVTSTLPILYPLGAVGTPSITFTGDTNTGIFSPGADQVAITTGGAARLTTSTTAVTSTLPVLHPLGAVGTPSITFTGDTNTGIFSPGADTLAFVEGGVEAFRVISDSTIQIGQTTTNTPGLGNTTTGAAFEQNNGRALFCSRADGAAGFFNRNNDGGVVVFNLAGVSIGDINVSGTTTTYNAFLGAHWAALTDWSRPEIKVGTILEAIDEITEWKLVVIDVDGEQKKICYNGNATPGTVVSIEYKGQTYEGAVELESDIEFEKSVKVKINDTAASKAVYGVFVSWDSDECWDGGVWNIMNVGALGNFVIRMAVGETPELGDLVESDGTGCAVVQDDDIIRTKTVGKITSTIPQVIYEDGSFLVTCVLYCG